MLPISLISYDNIVATEYSLQKQAVIVVSCPSLHIEVLMWRRTRNGRNKGIDFENTFVAHLPDLES